MTDKEFINTAYKFNLCLEIHRILIDSYAKKGLTYQLHQYCDIDTLESLYTSLLHLETFMNE